MSSGSHTTGRRRGAAAGPCGTLQNRRVIARLLTVTDLDELHTVAEALAGTARTGDDEAAVVGVVAAWTDEQALANLLMYPTLIPADFRAAAIERALATGEHSYLCLAAVVGIERLDRAQLTDEVRVRLIQRLLDLIASDDGIVADRASISIGTLLSSGDAPDLVELLLHPSAPVRHNLVHALFGLTGAAGIAALLDGAGFVQPETRTEVRAQLATDGVDLDNPSEEQLPPRVLSYVPNYTDWT